MWAIDCIEASFPVEEFLPHAEVQEVEFHSGNQAFRYRPLIAHNDYQKAGVTNPLHGLRSTWQ
jgi:hypothetical protein